MDRLGQVSLEFYNHFENDYYRFKPELIKLCKLVFHLPLHIRGCVLESGPPVGYSQYGMERYIGWQVGRLNAKNLASASLHKNALFTESFKIRFKVPFAGTCGNFAEVEGQGGFVLKGMGYRRRFAGGNSDDDRLYLLMRSYLTRKYDGMTPSEADGILDRISCATYFPCMEFVCATGTQTVGTNLQVSSWHRERHRDRAN